MDLFDVVCMLTTLKLDDFGYISLPHPVVDFFNRINLIYGTICDNCTEESCPVMSGGPKFEYRWADGHKYKKPTALSAPQYITLLMEWVEAQINDETIFPVTVGKSRIR